MTSNLDQAFDDIHDGQWANAQIAFDRARWAASANPAIFSPEEIRRFNFRIDQAEKSLRSAEERVEPSAGLLSARLESAGILCGGTNVMRDLRKTALKLYESQRSQESLFTVEQMLVLDPDNEFAQSLRTLLLTDIEPSGAASTRVSREVPQD